ncbi:MAG: CPBP family intramembrane glutamic endopeptidase [Candidatus Heimdallarchaeota archaeon]
MTEILNNSEEPSVIELDTERIKPIKNELIWYFIATLVWMFTFLIPSVLNSQGVILLPEWSTAVLGGFAIFGPTIIAIIFTRVNEGNKGVIELLKKGIKTKFKKKWLIPTFLISPILAGIAFGISILAFGYTLEENYYNIGSIIGVVFIAFFIGGPLAEEFGWRGYALEKLQEKFGAFSSSLILGIIWSIWHLPLHFILSTTQYYIPIWAFFLITTTQSVIYTWLYNNTNGSVLVVILFHWISNIAGALLPYWQLGFINGQTPNGTYIPTYGMFIGFGITLIFVIVIATMYGPKKLMKNRANVIKGEIHQNHSKG